MKAPVIQSATSSNAGRIKGEYCTVFHINWVLITGLFFLLKKDPLLHKISNKVF